MARYYCPTCGQVADDCSYQYWRAPGYERKVTGKKNDNAVRIGTLYFELTVKPHRMLSLFANLRESLPNDTCPGGITKDRAP